MRCLVCAATIFYCSYLNSAFDEQLFLFVFACVCVVVDIIQLLSWRFPRGHWLLQKHVLVTLLLYFIIYFLHLS